MDKVIWRLFQAITAVILAGMATAAVMLVLRWLVDLGPLWAPIALGAIVIFIGVAIAEERN